jgi:hypothetical protein
VASLTRRLGGHRRPNGSKIYAVAAQGGPGARHGGTLTRGAVRKTAPRRTRVWDLLVNYTFRGPTGYTYWGSGPAYASGNIYFTHYRIPLT